MKNRILKALTIGLFIILVLFSLTGCDDIATKEELIEYAEDKYGECICINYIKNEKISNETNFIEGFNDKSIGIFKDKEYGFTYSIESYIIEDPSVGNIENKRTNFDEVYISYIEDRLSLKLSEFKKIYKCSLEWDDGKDGNTDILVSINIEDSYLSKDSATALRKIIKKIDSREYFEDSKISVVYNGEEIGQYHFSKNKYYTSEELHINDIRDELCYNMRYEKNIDITDENKLKHIKTEVMKAKDIPNIENEGIEYIITDIEKTYEVYYFKYKNQTWILADGLLYNGVVYVTKIN